MRWVMLIYVDDERAAEWERLSAPEQERALAPYLDWYARGVEAGRVVEGQRLAWPPATTTVRHDGEESLVTDGPFTETKEMLGGLMLLEASDRGEAVAIARTWPGLGRDGHTLEILAGAEVHRGAPTGADR